MPASFRFSLTPYLVPEVKANRYRGVDALQTAHLVVDGVYTNKAPGGVAYRCSFRVTEAAYCIERAMDIMAQKLGMDAAEFRMKNFIRREQFPYHSALGWEYDSGDYHTAMEKAMSAVRYKELRAEQAAKRAAFKRGETREIMGIGIGFFTEIVGAGPSKNCDILGIAMFDSCEIRVHPTGAVIARMGTKSQGQGHEITYAQIIASEIGIPSDGNVKGGSFLDFFIPTAVETPRWETHFTVTPSPHHPIGAKGVGESANVGGVPAFSNAVNDAFSFLGTTHIQMSHDHWRNWMAAKKLGVLG